MGEDEEAGDGAGATDDVRTRLGSDFGPRLASGGAMGVVAAACMLSGPLPFAVLVVVVAVLLSWEWGRLVHDREADLVIAVHVGAAGVAAVLAAAGFVGPGVVAAGPCAPFAPLVGFRVHSPLPAVGGFSSGRLPARPTCGA